MVFGINSASNAVRKCEIVRGEAECYFTLPDCTVWTILLQINPTSAMSLIGTVLFEHSMLLLLKNLTIEGQLLIVAAISIGVAMVAGSGSSTGLKSELRMCSAFELHVCSFKKQTIEGQKTQSLLLLQPYYCFYAQLKVAMVRPKQVQLVYAAHGTREPC